MRAGLDIFASTIQKTNLWPASREVV